MSVRCPGCRRRCVGGADAWVTCLMCGHRFYSVAGGEGTEETERFEPRRQRSRPPASASGPALGYASLACSLFFPLLAGAVSHFYPESGAALVTMGTVLAIAFGAAFGFGAFKLSSGPGKLFGMMGMAFAVLQSAFLAAALWVGELW